MEKKSKVLEAITMFLLLFASFFISRVSMQSYSWIVAVMLSVTLLILGAFFVQATIHIDIFEPQNRKEFLLKAGTLFYNTFVCGGVIFFWVLQIGTDGEFQRIMIWKLVTWHTPVAGAAWAYAVWRLTPKQQQTESGL